MRKVSLFRFHVANKDPFIPNLLSLPSAEENAQYTPRNSVLDTRLPRAVQRKVVPSEEFGGELWNSAKMGLTPAGPHGLHIERDG